MKLPNPKLEDELAKEYVERWTEEDDFYVNWPTIRYDDPDIKVPIEPTKNPKPKK